MKFSLRYKIIYLTLVPTTLVYFSVLFFSLYQSEKEIQLDIKNETHQYTQYYSLYYASFLREAMQVGHSSALFLQNNLQMSRSKLYKMVKDNVALNPIVFGSAIAFDYDELDEDGDELFFAPYAYRSKGKVVSIDISKFTNYKQSDWEWWNRATVEKKGFWTSPYFSQTSNEQSTQTINSASRNLEEGKLMATYAVPILDKNEFVGVITVDIALEPLEQTVSKVLPTDREFLILNSKGEYLYSKNSKDILSRSIYDDIKLPGTKGLAKLADEMLSGQVGMTKVTGWKPASLKTEWVFFRTIPMTDWRLAVRLDEEHIINKSRDDVLQTGLLMLISLNIIIVVIWLVIGHITSPLARLTKNVSNFSLGKEETITDLDRNDEIGLLARNFLEMTKRLHSEQTILEEKNEAERANKAKSVFLSNMTHELRTPLNGVLGYTQVLQSDPNNTLQQTQNLEAIESCGNHLLSLINDVLDISKIERGYMHLLKTDFELSRLLQDVYNIVKPRAEAKGLVVELKIDEICPKTLFSDKTKLKQILINLMGNAIKFTQQGTVTLSVSPILEQALVNSLSFSVKDTGIGIETADQELIFDAFKQAEEGLDEGGTGLGLAISQRLALELGFSKIKLSSIYGQGSTFEFVVPLNESNYLNETQDIDALSEPISDESHEDINIPSLDKQNLKSLYRASQLGDLAELESLLERIQVLGDAYTPIHQKLDRWVKGFDFKKIEDFAQSQLSLSDMEQ